MMHKIVNGKKLYLTEEEAKRVKEEWETNRIKLEIEKKERIAQEEKKQNLKKSACDKLMNIGLSPEEIEVFIKF